VSQARTGIIMYFSHVNCSLSTQISYAPWTRPSPFSPARQSVYDDGMRQLLGPRQDVSGWTSLPPAVVNGRLNTKKDVAVTCTVSSHAPLLPNA
jgi:hypothetical protein